ncbi:MAG: alpha/beta hydrolase [Pirellulales bacterium]|nr:alpha/beta hydrolase [Pirellulales bacterium]
MPESPLELVDAEFRKILKVLNGPAYTPVHQLTPAEARAQTEQFFQGPPVTVVGSQRDFTAETPLGDIRCRLYHPQPGTRLPLLIYYHGGGWVLGDLDSIHGVTASLAARSGCAVLSVDYRLAPEHPFPAAVDDALAALRWAAENGEQLEIDPARIAVGGDSAGGNLAAVVSILARDAGGPAVQFQLLIYPATDAACHTRSMDRFAEGLVLEKKDMLWFWDHYCADRTLRQSDVRASPLRVADAAGLPPAYLLLAELDPLVDEGRAYAERLEVVGGMVTCRVVSAAIHAFLGFWQVSELADRELTLAAEAVAAALGGDSA